jgi:hypothetical protein
MNLLYVDVNKTFDIRISSLQKCIRAFVVSTSFVAVFHPAQGKQLII